MHQLGGNSQSLSSPRASHTGEREWVVWGAGPCKSECFTCARGGESSLIPTLAKAKAWKTVAKLWVIESRTQSPSGMPSLVLKETSVRVALLELLEWPCPPSSLLGFPDLESISLSLYYERKKTRPRKLLRLKNWTILAKLLLSLKFIVPSIMWRQTYLLCEYPEA